MSTDRSESKTMSATNESAQRHIRALGSAQDRTVERSQRYGADGAVPQQGLELYRVDRAEIYNIQSNISDTANALRSQMEDHAELVEAIQDIAVQAYRINHKLDHLERSPSGSGKWTLPRKSTKVVNLKRTIAYISELMARSYSVASNLKRMLAESTAAQMSITQAVNNAIPAITLGLTAVRIANEPNEGSESELLDDITNDNVSLNDFSFDQQIANLD